MAGSGHGGSDQEEGGSAWRVTPNEYLRRSPPCHDGYRRSSSYVAVRDGTRLAVDVHLPGSEATPERHPTVVCFTPYYRRFALRANHRDGVEASPNTALYRNAFVPRGYALVVVDVRGCGASYGSRDGFRSPRERLDYHDMVDWIVRQPWCDGNVGATGISYVGAAADFLASTGHPAVKAVVPTFSVWDTWSNHLYPGGVLLTFLPRQYGDLARALDEDRREDLRAYPYFADPDYAGPAPVDEDADGALLRAALRDHLANFDMTDFAQQFRHRDDGLSDNPEYGSAKISPYHYADRKNDAHTAIYGVTGWMDGGGFSNGSIQRFRWLRNPARRLLIGPWDHGARCNVSPWRKETLPRFAVVGEALRFFDEHLRGVETGLAREQPVHYFTMGEECWKAAATWPPPQARPLEFYLADDRGLSREPPALEGSDSYQADYGCGSGRQTRYDRLAATVVETYYPDWHGRDDAMLTYTTNPLEEDTELTGHPLAILYLTCSEPDCALFVYLEDVADDGTCRYVTEGVFRALHRKLGETPASLPDTGPPHSFNRADAALLTPWEPAELAFDLLPTSYLFRCGHRIRVAIAAADRDHFSRIPDGRPPLLTFYRGGERASRLSLPIVPRTVPTNQGASS